MLLFYKYFRQKIGEKIGVFDKKNKAEFRKKLS
jgi:hypothetical protein